MHQIGYTHYLYCNSKDKQYDQLFWKTTTTAMFDHLRLDGCGYQHS